MIYFVILLNNIPESYGSVKEEREFWDKKEMLEAFGCTVKRVSRMEFEKVKRKIDIKTHISRSCFKLVSGGEIM